MYLINAGWAPLKSLFKKEIQSRDKKTVEEKSFKQAEPKVKENIEKLQYDIQNKLKNKNFQNIVNTHEFHELEIAVAIQIYNKILNSNNFSECYPLVKQLLYNYNYLEESFKGTVYALLLLANDHTAKENQVAEIYFELKAFFPEHQYKEAVLHSLISYLTLKKVDFINRDYLNLMNEIKNENKDPNLKTKLNQNEENFLKAYFKNWENIKQYNTLVDIAKKTLSTENYELSTKIDACKMLIKIYEKIGIKELVNKYKKQLVSLEKKNK